VCELQRLEGAMGSEAGRLRARALRASWAGIAGERPEARAAEAEAARPWRLSEEEREETARAALGANAEFYDAFNARDLAAMGELWSAEAAACSCVHPDKKRVVGRDAILRSWEGVLRAPTCPTMDILDEVVLLAMDGCAVVSCVEETSTGGCLQATNCFVRGEGGVWHCVGHHAGAVVGGAGGLAMSAMGQGLAGLWPWASRAPEPDGPVGVAVRPPRQVARRAATPPRGAATREDQERELEARESVERLLAAAEAAAASEAASLEARAALLRWQAAVEELDREGERGAAPAGHEGEEVCGRRLETEAVRAAARRANSAYYRAFNERDGAALARLWAPAGMVSQCAQPGRTFARGREAVLSSWEGLLGNRALPTVEAVAEQVLLEGPEGAVVACTEEVSTGGCFEATNTFARGEDGNLYMVGHHT
ncbi:unnamed protein product, partial [Prorocentrum cordatum]